MHSFLLFFSNLSISGCKCSLNPSGVGFMNCNCPDNSGKQKANSVDLSKSPVEELLRLSSLLTLFTALQIDQCIGNDNGKLVC